MSQIKPYDVVTYDSISNTLIVSDLRLTCRYQNPAPNAKAPRPLSCWATPSPYWRAPGTSPATSR